MTRLEEGDIGPGYGFQWRHFNGHYKTCNDKYTGIDQLQSAIDILKIHSNNEKTYEFPTLDILNIKKYKRLYY